MKILIIFNRLKKVSSLIFVYASSSVITPLHAEKDYSNVPNQVQKIKEGKDEFVLFNFLSSNTSNLEINITPLSF